MFRLISFIVLVCCPPLVMAQKDTLNQKDGQGLKQGFWIFYGKDIPERGYCDSCKVEEGNYLDNRKNGLWTMYYKNDTIPRLTGTFLNGRPEGIYKKFYANGKISEEGNYHIGKQIGLFKTYYQSGCLALEKYFDENGKESGTVTYYYDDCNQELNAGSIKLEYDATIGSGITQRSQCVSTTTVAPEIDSLCICGVSCLINDGKTFQPNGHNRIYNKNGDPWIEGEFKDGRIYNVKVYKYDADGILLKIEIWKYGFYCCQGDL
jgi:antitoxin component YwqK of YwqJK toxin-antitoxin module